MKKWILLVFLFISSKVFLQQLVWRSNEGQIWKELETSNANGFKQWQEGAGEIYAEKTRKGTKSNFEVIVDCPGRGCYFKLSNTGAYYQYYNSSDWVLFLYGKFDNGAVSNIDFYIDDKNIIFAYSISSLEPNSYFDISFNLQNEKGDITITPKSLLGDYSCVKADLLGEATTVKTVKWIALNDKVNLTGKYRLVCAAVSSPQWKIDQLIAVEKKRQKEAKLLEQKIAERNLFLIERANKIYDYCELKPNVIKTNNSLITSGIQEIINRTDEGNLFLKTSYKFDTLGFFKGRFSASGQMGPNLNEFLNSNYSKLLLSPSVKNDLFVASECLVDFNLNWHTDYIRFKYKKNLIQSSIQIDGTAYSQIESKLKNQMVDGHYTFKRKYITVNDQTFNRITFDHYRNNRGPLNVFYSMLLPGLGTKRVTYSNKGTGRMILFILGAGVSAASKYYSNIYYNKYLISTNQVDIQYNYRMANNLQKSFLISGGFAASIYIYDFFHVIGRGIKNKKEQHFTNRNLSNQDLIINQDIKL